MNAGCGHSAGCTCGARRLAASEAAEFPGAAAAESILPEIVDYGRTIYQGRTRELLAVITAAADAAELAQRLAELPVPLEFTQELGTGLWAGQELASEAGRREVKAKRKTENKKLKAKTAAPPPPPASGEKRSAAAADFTVSGEDFSGPNLEADFLRLRSFWISHVDDAQTLAALKGELQQVLEGTGTYGDFRAKAEELLGGALTDLHLETIFRTNLQTAYNSGKYYEGRAAEAELPYWQYRTVGDDRVRPEHAALDGLVYRKDSGFWNTWYPPNGFNCRCTVVELDDLDLQAEGLTVQSAPPKFPNGDIVPEPEAGFAGNAAMDPQVLTELSKRFDFVQQTPADYGLDALPAVAAPAGKQPGYEDTLRDEALRPRTIPVAVWQAAAVAESETALVEETLADPLEIWAWPGKGLVYLATYETEAGERTVAIEVWGTVQAIHVVAGGADRWRTGLLVRKN